MVCGVDHRRLGYKFRTRLEKDGMSVYIEDGYVHRACIFYRNNYKIGSHITPIALDPVRGTFNTVSVLCSNGYCYLMEFGGHDTMIDAGQRIEGIVRFLIE
jgi:hypothetical protein